MRKITAILISFCTLFFSITIPVSAIEYEIPVKILEPEEVQEALGYYQITKLTEAEEPSGENIYFIDVNDQGEIIASFYRGKKIGIYNKDGEYQYGYSLHSNGYFAAKWVDDSETIMIYFARGDSMVILDANGNCIEMADGTDSNANSEFWHNTLSKAAHRVDDTIYYLKNDNLISALGGGYSKLIRRNADGTEQVLYDAGESNFVGNLLAAISFLVLFVGISTGVIIYVVRFYKNHQGESQSITKL